MRERVSVDREQVTMLMTLYLHARDSRSARPVLADRFAADLVDRVDYDFSSFTRLHGNQPLIVGRAKAIDHLVREFLEIHDDAVVAHLGCGLDSRVLRVDPGPGVTWFEIDQEPVIDLRRRVYAPRAGVTNIAASVTDPSWQRGIPVDRPQLFVAEGLLMYLDADGVRTVVDTLADGPALPRRLIADTVAPWVQRVAGRQRTMKQASTGFRSSTSDLHRAMDAHPGLRRSRHLSMVTAARDAATGALAAFIGVIAASRHGRDAMVLDEYDQRLTATG